MEPEHKKRIKEQFRNENIPKVVNLDIPDEYEFMNKDLIELIKSGTENYL